MLNRAKASARAPSLSGAGAASWRTVLLDQCVDALNVNRYFGDATGVLVVCGIHVCVLEGRVRDEGAASFTLHKVDHGVRRRCTHANPVQVHALPQPWVQLNGLEQVVVVVWQRFKRLNTTPSAREQGGVPPNVASDVKHKAWPVPRIIGANGMNPCQVTCKIYYWIIG